MNGEPLPIEHGFPVRMVVPGLYGYVSATKWVAELKVTTFAEDQGYWTPLGWSARGPIKLASRIDVPRKATVDAGTVVGRRRRLGPAHRHRARSRSRSTQGPWQPAELAETTGPDTWRQWRYAWPATPGSHTLTVRATDAEGNVQIAEPRAARPGRRHRLPHGPGQGPLRRPGSTWREPCGFCPRDERCTRFDACASRWPGSRVPGEARVALVPELVGRLTARRLRGRRRSRAPGRRALLTDDAYAAAGADGQRGGRRPGRSWWSACSRCDAAVLADPAVGTPPPSRSSRPRPRLPTSPAAGTGG